jgi:transposase
VIAAGTKVYFAVKPADLRRTFSLAALASAELAKDPMQGGLFIFLNRKGDQARVIFKDPHGWCLLCKRLDRGRFRRPACEDGRLLWELDAAELMRWLDDIEPTRASVRRARAASRGLLLLRSDAQSPLVREHRPV